MYPASLVAFTLRPGPVMVTPSWSHTVPPSPHLPHYGLFSWSTESECSKTNIRASDSPPLASQGPGIEFQIHNFRIWLLSAFTPTRHTPSTPTPQHTPNPPWAHPCWCHPSCASLQVSLRHCVRPQPGPLPGRLVLTFRALLQGHLLLEALLIVLPQIASPSTLPLILPCFSSYALEDFV